MNTKEQINHGERAHSVLSPSASGRWSKCPGSIKLSEFFADETSEAAEEGTLAHEVCELMLACSFRNKKEQPSFKEEIEKIKKNSLFNDEMIGYAEGYKNYVIDKFCAEWHDEESKIMPSVLVEKKVSVLVEKKVSIPAIHPNCFGCVDCSVIGRKDIYIIDFKYGKGVRVDAVNNKQMIAYASGIYEKYGHVCKEKPTFHLCIYQPRIDNISEWDITLGELLAEVKELRKAAEEALGDNPRVEAGDHCTFCKALPVCKAKATEFEELYSLMGKDPKVLTKDELVMILTKGADLNKYVNSVKDFAVSAWMEGNTIEGMKMVERQGNRYVADAEGLKNWLVGEGYEEEDILKPAELKGLTDLGKLVGKKRFDDETEQFMDRKKSNYNIVAEDAPGRPWTPEVSAKEEFKDFLI